MNARTNDDGARPWSYDGQPINPHTLDYKRRLHEDMVPEVLRWLARSPNDPPLPLAAMMNQLRGRSDRRAYPTSSKKQGLFLQASCVVTARDQTSGSIHVVLQARSARQFHDPRDLRNLTGTACLIGTVAGRATFLDDQGHISNDLFPRIHDGRTNALALFGRKLLVPAPLVHARFLGLGFNIAELQTSKGVGYLHLVWEVSVERTDLLSPAMIVPERANVPHDSLLPAKLDDAVELVDAKAVIDRCVLESLRQGIPGPARLGGSTSGLLGTRMFSLPNLQSEDGQIGGSLVHRDAIIFDLLRMFQTAVHRGTVPVLESNERAFQNALRSYLDSLARTLPFRIDVEREVYAGTTEREGRIDFVVRVSNHVDRERSTPAHWEYLIECKVSDAIEFASKDVAQCREYSTRRVRADGPKLSDGRAECVILLQGIRGANSVHGVGGFETIDADAHIFGLRVALDWRVPSKQLPVVEVAHVLVAVRVRGELALVITRPPTESASPRLVGGRMDLGIEGGKSAHVEPPEVGARRELREELGLGEDEVEALLPILPSIADGVHERSAVDRFFPATAVNRAGDEKEYRFFPHLVLLKPAGIGRVIRALHEGRSAEGHQLGVVAVDQWRETGLGFSPLYASRVLNAIPRADLERAAFDVPGDDLAQGVLGT